MRKFCRAPNAKHLVSKQSVTRVLDFACVHAGHEEKEDRNRLRLEAVKGAEAGRRKSCVLQCQTS